MRASCRADRIIAINNVNTAQARFDRALSFLQGGDTQLTVDLCRSALGDQPHDGKMRVLLGTALNRQHQFKAAEAELRRVIEQWPDIPKAHRELGNALLGQGRANDAIDSFRRVVALTPDRAVAHFDLSVALSKLGHDKEAQAALEAALRLEPERGQLLEALEHHRAGRLSKAEQLYRDVLGKEPTNVNATRLLGSLATEIGRHRLAVRLLRNAVKLAPEFFGARADLARALIEKEDFADAHKAVAKAIQMEPELPYPRMLLGNLLSKEARYEEAAEAYRVALQKQPDHGGSLAALGHVLKTVGKQEEAIEMYRECIRNYPAFGEAYWSLANLKTFRFSDAEVATMEQYVDSDTLLDETRVNLNYALGKACEDRSDYARSFTRYKKGSAIRRANESYDPVQTETIHDQIIETITPDLLRQHGGAGHPDPSPIFIVGLPRSGSTLIEQILASHSLVEGTHELPDLPRLIRHINEQRPQGDAYPKALKHYDAEQLAELGQRYIVATRRHRRDSPFFTDKMPNNFASIGLLALILPNATIINARRHPLDSCMGSFKQLFYKGQAFTYDLVELGEYYLQYQRMMDYWHSILPGKILDVHYEQMVLDQEQQTRRLIEHCGLPWEDACLRFYATDRAVNTASSEQVRQPIYSKSINSWRNFEAQLEPLIEVLEPLLMQLPVAERPVRLAP